MDTNEPNNEEPEHEVESGWARPWRWLGTLAFWTTILLEAAFAEAKSWPAGLKSWLACQWRRLGALAFWTTVLLEVGLMVGAWWLYCAKRDRIEAARNDDPLHEAHSFGGGETSKTGLADERTLPGGERVRIDNGPARFEADMDPEDPHGERLFPSFAAAIQYSREQHLELLPSCSLILHRLRREDNQLIETVQLEINRRMAELLRGLDWKLSSRPDDGAGAAEARAMIAAAISLGGQSIEDRPPAIRDRARSLVAQFASGDSPNSRRRGETMAQVAARYARDPQLASLFRQQRFLMEPLPDGAARALGACLADHPGLKAQLEAIIALRTALDNPPEAPYLLNPVDQPGGLGRDLNGGVCLLPPALSPENRYFYEKYPEGLPSEVNWLEEVIRGVRSHQLDPTPRPGDGWAGDQFFALAPLVRRDLAFEVASRKLDPSTFYVTFMEETFRAGLAGVRESHIVAVLAPIPLGISGGDGWGPLKLAPRFSCEPAPAVYWHLAQAYGHLDRRLTQLAGDEPATGPLRVAAARASRLSRCVRGLAAVAFLELGLPPDQYIKDSLPAEWSAPPAGWLQAEAGTAREWLRALPGEPPLSEDPRFVVAAAAGRRWGAIGVRLRKLRYEFKTSPRVTMTGPGGGERDIDKQSAIYYAPLLVAAEFRRPLDDAAFKALCTRCQTVKECFSRLGAPLPEEGDGLWSWPPVLAVLTLIIGAHLAWRFRQRRRRLAKYRAAARRSGWLGWIRGLVLWTGRMALRIVLLFFFVTLLSLQLVPRMDLPRLYAAVPSVILIRLVYDPLNIHDFSLLPVFNALLARALDSGSRPVRENALNLVMYSFSDGSYHGERILAKALRRLCLCRDYGETRFALDYLTFMHDYKYNDSTAAKTHLDWLRPILARFDNDPILVMKCWALVEESGGAPKDITLLEEAIRKAPPDAVELWGALRALQQTHPEIMPYDWLVRLGYLNQDVAKLPESILPPPILMTAIWSHYESLNGPYQSTVAQGTLSQEQLNRQRYDQQAREDPRIPPLLFEACRRSALEKRTSIFSERVNCLHPKYRKTYYFQTIDWLLTAARDPGMRDIIEKSLQAICGHVESHHSGSGVESDDAYYWAIETLLGIGYWNDWPCEPIRIEYDRPLQETYGGLFKEILDTRYPHPHPNDASAGQTENDPTGNPVESGPNETVPAMVTPITSPTVSAGDKMTTLTQ